MAQIAIPESVGRTLYHTFLQPTLEWVVFDTVADAPSSLAEKLQTLPGDRYVVKPDYLIGKRGKLGLLGVNLDAAGVEEFLQKTGGREFEGLKLTRFLLSPFVPHEAEYYVSITALPEQDRLSFSSMGGVDIEEHWQSIVTVDVSVLDEPSPIHFKPFFSDIDAERQKLLETYLVGLVNFFRRSNLVFLEINPLVIVDKKVIPLDVKSRLDSCALFQLQREIDIYPLVERSSLETVAEEQRIRELDQMTDGSLKLKLLNRNGRIWPMVAGGGASIIYFDSLTAQGLAEEIGFYGEYSGNPPLELVRRYTEVVLELLLASTATNKVLLLAGANANFTDIERTTAGIIQALQARAAELRDQKITILVRRGGPNVEQAFAQLQELATKENLSIRLEGTERSLPAILEYLPS